MKRVITKEEINRLPIKSFPGRIHLISTRDGVRRVFPRLKEERLLGFDTETKPAFQKGQRFPIALIQLATEKEAFLFRVGRLGIPRELGKIIERPQVIKVAQGAREELTELAACFGLRGAGFVDLLELARRLNCSPRGVRALTAIFLGFRISKSAQRTNWERERLSDKQLLYAATDAWVCLQIYRAIVDRGILPSPPARLSYRPE